MKKLLCVLWMLLMLGSLAACGSVHVHRVRQDFQDGDCPQCRHRIQREGKREFRHPCTPSVFGKNCRGDEAYV